MTKHTKNIKVEIRPLLIGKFRIGNRRIQQKKKQQVSLGYGCYSHSACFVFKMISIHTRVQ